MARGWGALCGALSFFTWETPSTGPLLLRMSQVDIVNRSARGRHVAVGYLGLVAKGHVEPWLEGLAPLCSVMSHTRSSPIRIELQFCVDHPGACLNLDSPTAFNDCAAGPADHKLEIPFKAGRCLQGSSASRQSAHARSPIATRSVLIP